VEDTQRVLNGLNNWCICHVRKNANSAAHNLAKATIKQITYIVWMEEIHSCICDIVLLEQLALSFLL
jgi:hypothetical protein